MKIAVLGTSNSISRVGWEPLFERISPDWTVRNFSLGASCSLFMLPQLVARQIVEEFDVCIIEAPVNDQRHIDFGFFSLECFSATFAAIMAAFANEHARCSPIVLAIPTRDGLTSGIRNTACHTLGAMCNLLGIDVLDAGTAIRIASTHANTPRHCVFRAKSATDSGMKSATDSDLISAIPI